MALATQTLLSLMQKLGESTGEFYEFDTTTNIAANNYIISTTLGQYDAAEDDHFGGAGTEWWVYITEGVNIGVNRKTTDYSAASTRITVAGAVLGAESAAVTCRLYRYDRGKLKNAIIRACEEIYPALYLPLDDQTLITGNILPDNSFEDWSSSSALTWYSGSNVTLAKTSTSGYARGSGTYSAKATAGAANGYISIDSNSYPKLFDLQGQTVSLYARVQPEVANDAKLVIYYERLSGGDTLTSTTTSATNEWTIIKLEDQAIPDTLDHISIRFQVATNAKYVYFDDAMLQGRNMYEYLLPSNFRDGDLDSVFMQTNAHSDQACYDYRSWVNCAKGYELPPLTINDGTQRYWTTPVTLPTERRLRLLGKKPLETLSADADTITLDAHRVPLLIAKARMIFWEREAVPISSQDKTRFEIEYAKAERDYRRLLKLRMPMSARMV